jgi:hypothetical protein
MGRRKKAILVNEEELKSLIDGLELNDKKRNEYLRARWLNYVLWWDARAAEAKCKYFALRGAVVVAGALVPALIGLRELNVWGEDAWVFAVLAILASLVVAICTGIESLFGFGNIWREKRAAAELIKIEGFRFFQLTGGYDQGDKTHADLYATFAAKVEDMIEREIKDYVVAVKSPDKTE